MKQAEALEDAHILTIADQREREIARINLDAQRKAALVVGTEQEMTDQRVAINEERERKLQELSAKYQDAADKQKKEDFERQIADEDAAEQEREAKFLENFEKGLETQKQYDQYIYDAKHASLQAKLALEEAYAGKTSKLYLATNKELLALEKDHNKQVIADTDKREKAKRETQLLSVKTAGDVLQTTIDILFQGEAARKKHHNLYTALSGAKIIMDGVQEVASIWRYSAENPLNGVTGGVACAVIGGVQTALAVARTVYGLTRLQEFSFAKGGRTGSGMMMGSGEAQGGGMAVSPMGTLMEMSGIAIGSNGKLMDNSGFAVAGLVHEDEYVVPKWMRQDPQVAAVEQWLEAKRLRGYAEGTGTGGATLPAAAAAPQSDGELLYAAVLQLLDQSKQQTAQLADVKSWQARLAVYLDLAAPEAGQSERKQVQLENGIRK
ncbi:hypothetical protein [Hymenobacter convexus]|uniref:hypothetical protein n=1 Tax=Hymenobacter sp. CA1UV-4 TaxID=3063782 RepID=UPI00271428C8|nr:hypothetical protein [Hymenobacter sp. CA1UV-4]MDO7852309.1 hypothetical protein [Hymenobacter sp. CA1UV-4]